MRCRLWLGLAWLLLARAPGAARTSGGLRRPRSYPHLEGDVRWRRLFSSTHFFLRVDPSGLVQGTRWCHSPDTCSGCQYPLEKARLFPTYTLQCVRGTSSGQAHTGIIEIRSIRVGVVALKAVHTGFFVAMSRRGHLYGSRIYTAHCRFQERIEENGYNTYASLRWRHRGRPMFLALDRRGVPRRGGRTRRHQLSTHFLPVMVS